MYSLGGSSVQSRKLVYTVEPIRKHGLEMYVGILYENGIQIGEVMAYSEGGAQSRINSLVKLIKRGEEVGRGLHK